MLSPITKAGIVFGVPIEFEFVNKARRDCFLKLEVPHSQGSLDVTFKLHQLENLSPTSLDVSLLCDAPSLLFVLD